MSPRDEVIETLDATEAVGCEPRSEDVSEFFGKSDQVDEVYLELEPEMELVFE